MELTLSQFFIELNKFVSEKIGRDKGLLFPDRALLVSDLLRRVSCDHTGAISFATDEIQDGKLGIVNLLYEFDPKKKELKVAVVNVSFGDGNYVSSVFDKSKFEFTATVSLRDEPLVAIICPECGSIEVVEPGSISEDWVKVSNEDNSFVVCNSGDGDVESGIAADFAMSIHEEYYQHGICGYKLQKAEIQDISIAFKFTKEGAVDIVKVGNFWKSDKESILKELLLNVG